MGFVGLKYKKNNGLVNLHGTLPSLNEEYYPTGN